MHTSFTLNSKMKEVEARFPFARSKLHTQFHIGGCTNCGYEPYQTIEEVALKYQKEPNALLLCLNSGLEDMNQTEISVLEFSKLLTTKRDVLLLDVREEWEYNIVHIPNSILLSEINFESLILKAKEIENVTVICHHGMRSMNAALYLREHGVLHAKSLRGGIDAYSIQCDKSLQRY